MAHKTKPLTTKKEDTKHEDRRLPSDLETEILVRLPAIQLMEFQCVCKDWRDLFENPDFIKYHTRIQFHEPYYSNNNNKKNNGSVILFDHHSLLSMDLHSPRMNLACHRLPRFFEPVNLAGSSNGLLCFRVHPSGANLKAIRYSLYNPTTNINYRYTTPPLILEEAYNYHVEMDGFGYDCTGDDYKILCSTSCGTKDYVYSLKTNSWKFIQPPSVIENCRLSSSMTLSNNALHWIGYNRYDTRSRRIFSFDLGTEEYHMVPQPDDDNDEFSDQSSAWFLHNLNGCLHLFKYTSSTNDRQFHDVRIWAMKYYGLGQSWTKLVHHLSFKQLVLESQQVHNSYSDETNGRSQRRVYPRYGFGDPPKPYAYSKNELEIIFALDRGNDDIRFVHYDLRIEKLTKDKVCGLPDEWKGRATGSCEVLPWISSLVSLPDMKN